MRSRQTLADAVWRGSSPGAKALRAALVPAAGLFRGVVAVRNRLYDHGSLRAKEGPIAVASVGNISVGGAGKTPVAAWLARQSALRGASPGVVMRGYGGDEPMVHRELNPDIPVLLNTDRVAGIRAAARIGCDVVILDDAFQHRSAARDEDIVLVSADSWRGSRALLPAGPWREPLSAVRRASLLLITVKAAPPATVRRLQAELTDVAPAVPLAIARLGHEGLHPLIGHGIDTLGTVRGRRVLAVAAVADPDAFFAQLEKAGATVTRHRYADHHAFSRRDAAELVAAAAAHDMLVCTLKDAVKLRSLWPPAAAPAWYVSQAITIEHGGAEVTALVQRLLAARAARAPHPRDLSST